MESSHRKYLKLALNQAQKSYEEGGVPVGAVMVADDQVVGQGHNQRVQLGDPTAHGEMDCFRSAGRNPDYKRAILYTTLSPCMMCSGTIVQFGIRQVVIGENENFPGNIGFLRQHGVDVVLIDDAECKELMHKFIEENPELWNEDIAGRVQV